MHPAMRDATRREDRISGFERHPFIADLHIETLASDYVQPLVLIVVDVAWRPPFPKLRRAGRVDLKR